jgi:hypothetical protein
MANAIWAEKEPLALLILRVLMWMAALLQWVILSGPVAQELRFI